MSFERASLAFDCFDVAGDVDGRFYGGNLFGMHAEEAEHGDARPVGHHDTCSQRHQNRAHQHH